MANWVSVLYLQVREADKCFEFLLKCLFSLTSEKRKLGGGGELWKNLKAKTPFLLVDEKKKQAKKLTVGKPAQ